MWSAFLPFAVATALLWFPGLAVLSLLRERLPWVEVLALAPLISIAAYFLIAVVLDRVGVRVSTWTVAVPVLVATGVAFAVVARGRRDARTPRGSILSSSAWRQHRVAYIWLGAVIVVASTMWVIAIGGVDIVLPYDDGANHGIFTRRILDLATIDPTVVVATDLGSTGGGVAYYPLALHLVSSFVASITGAQTALAIQVVVVAICAVLAPVAMFAFIRRLVSMFVAGVEPYTAAGIAALVAVATPFATWVNLLWGGLPTVTGISLLPSLLLAVLHVIAGIHRAAVTLGVVAYGLFVWHNPEVVTAGLLAIGAIAGWGRTQRHLVAPVLRQVALAASLAFVLLVPLLPTLRAGLAERVGGDSGNPVPVVDAIRSSLVNFQGASLLPPILGLVGELAAAAGTTAVLWGAIRLWPCRPVRGLLVVAAAFLVLATACISGVWIAQRIATPWYGNGYRILSSLLPVYALAVGATGAFLIGRWRMRTRRAAAAVVVAALAVTLGAEVVVSGAFGRIAFHDFTVVTVADRAGYAWIAANARPGERVLNDSHDGSMWMYDLGGVVPVFGPKSDLWGVDEFASRRHLRDNIAAIATNPQVRREAADLSVRYVLLGERLIRDTGRQLDVAAIASSPGLRLVYDVDGVRVYEIRG